MNNTEQNIILVSKSQIFLKTLKLNLAIHLSFSISQILQTIASLVIITKNKRIVTMLCLRVERKK